MPHPIELGEAYKAAAERDVQPLISEAAASFGVDTIAGREQLGEFLARAWMAGTRAAQDEQISAAARLSIDTEAAVSRLEIKPDD